MLINNKISIKYQEIIFQQLIRLHFFMSFRVN